MGKYIVFDCNMDLQEITKAKTSKDKWKFLQKGRCMEQQSEGVTESIF